MYIRVVAVCTSELQLCSYIRDEAELKIDHVCMVV